MKEKYITFIYRNIVVGGIQTLLLRLADALLENNCIVTIYYNTIYDNGEEDYKKRGIKVYKYKGDCPKKLNQFNESQFVIAFEVETYINLVITNHKYNNDINQIFLYSVHPYTFEYFYNGCKYSFLDKIFNKKVYRFITKTIEDGFVFFMDEQCINSTIKNYSINLKKDFINNCILRIIMEQKDSIILNKKNKKEIDFLTVSRADFPFKGYIKGLINEISEIEKEGYNTKLTIITSGEQIEKIYEWTGGNKKIKILKDIEYEELKNYYRSCDIYIGMGTTILEAASLGAIAIPVSPYTYECNSHGLFSDKPNWVLTEIGEGKSVHTLIKKIISISEDERVEIKKRMLNSVSELYGKNNILKKMYQLLNIEVDKKEQYNIIPFSYIFYNKIKRNIKKLAKRNK